MNYRNKYITEHKERKALRFFLVVAVAVGLILGVLYAAGVFDAPVVTPDVEYPMTNANVSWDQSFYGWSDAT